MVGLYFSSAMAGCGARALERIMGTAGLRSALTATTITAAMSVERRGMWIDAQVVMRRPDAQW